MSHGILHPGQFGPYLDDFIPALGVGHQAFMDTHQAWASATNGRNWSPEMPYREAGQTFVAPNPNAYVRGERMRTRVIPFDMDLVHDSLRGLRAGTVHTTDIDPRLLMATQPRITRGGLEYYMGQDDYQRTGVTYADQRNIGNKHPVIYENEDVGARFILSGHHRSTAALLKGQPLRGILVKGGSGLWGHEAGMEWLDRWR